MSDFFKKLDKVGTKRLDLLDAYNAKRKELSEAAKNLVTPAILEFMKDHKPVQAIGWTQYTPYFNDGEPCTFRLGTIYVSFTKEQPDDFYDDSDSKKVWIELSEYGVSKVPATVDSDVWEELLEFAETIENSAEDLELVFGDHVRVLINKDGIDIEEYEHD